MLGRWNVFNLWKVNDRKKFNWLHFCPPLCHLFRVVHGNEFWPWVLTTGYHFNAQLLSRPRVTQISRFVHFTDYLSISQESEAEHLHYTGSLHYFFYYSHDDTYINLIKTRNLSFNNLHLHDIMIKLIKLMWNDNCVNVFTLSALLTWVSV